jgi:hypothetical protein
MEMGVGEALISTLDGKGVPSMVQRTLVAPPRSKIGPLDPADRQRLFERSPLKGIYDTGVDRESAYELLKKRGEELEQQRAQAEQQVREDASRKASSGGSRRQGMAEAFAKSVMRSIGSGLGRQIVRGILGSIIGKGR